jgi:hypothetical protein
MRNKLKCRAGTMCVGDRPHSGVGQGMVDQHLVESSVLHSGGSVR